MNRTCLCLRGCPRVAPLGLFATLILACAEVFACGAQAQEPSLVPAGVTGYVTALHSSTAFDVNGKHVVTSPETGYGLMGSSHTEKNSPLAQSIKVGAYVKVEGPTDRDSKTTQAIVLFLRDESDRELSGIGVIDKVISAGPEPVIRTDGYTIRITSATYVTFSGEQKTISDIGPNNWLEYEGKRDSSGALAASKIKFLSSKQDQYYEIPGMELNKLTLFPAPSPQPGKKPPHKEKARYADGSNQFHATDDAALQERVRRIGQSVVPAYQKALPDGHPSKILFAFVAVDERGVRSEICSPDGLILIPKEVVERLITDSEFAAVLADGVAANLQRQQVRMGLNRAVLMDAEAVGDILGIFVPGLGLAAETGALRPKHRLVVEAQEQRARIALALMSDAGYDLRQAPEAWRLLAPQKLPADLDNLKYPDRSGYQISILSLQYKTDAPPSRQEASSAQP